MPEPTNKTQDVMLATLAQDVQHIVSMLTKLEASMATSETKVSARLDKLELEAKQAKDELRKDHRDHDDKVRSDLKELGLSNKKEIENLDAKIAAATKTATSAEANASKLLWVGGGVLAVLVAFAASLLTAKLLH